MAHVFKKLSQRSQNTFRLRQIIFNSYMKGHFSLLGVILITLLIFGTVSVTISLQDPQNSSVTMYENSSANSLFIQQSQKFNCSLSFLYTYFQSSADNQANTPYFLSFANSSTVLSLQISTLYGIFTPTASQNTCTVENCNIEIQNNCPKEVTTFAYFDIVEFTISGIPLNSTTSKTMRFSFNVLCDSSYSTNTFEWGLVIMIVFCTGMLIVVTIYSKAWSMGGNGIQITYVKVVVFWVLVVIAVIIAQFTSGVAQPLFEAVCFVLGVVGVWVCANEALFLLRIGVLERSLGVFGLFRIRVLDTVSLVVGLGVNVGYLFSAKNWVVNDVICLAIIVAGIKILKFTDLKSALFTLLVTLAVEETTVLIIHYAIGTSYNDLILNSYNFPFELQLPTLNPVYKQKCAWFPFTAIVYPGVFMSYLRRFDLSRNTNIYFITAVVVFMLGSVVWMFISVGSVHSWPYEIVTGPTMMILVVLFAYKRREIRTLWEGSFYDEDFANRDGLQDIKDAVDKVDDRDTELMRMSLMNGLKINSREDSDLSLLHSKSGGFSLINDSI